ncbi:hypothetical protein RvY_06493-3 [Ramazzottius varieornatus]|uniref:Uncharacterized protein n=1 Tax=Ramazzottius varieornatus TaxID=947166 RepID=A0A1D1UYV3_RAMVA|nr:hypothetical protein RvY_06493-3 [Ramazzottius varieornatus]
MWSNGVWAPELHRINGQFYAYVVSLADNGNNINHRMYVLRADDSNNPMGAYTFIGKIADAGKDWWAIDGTVMQHRNGRNYFIYSGWVKRKLQPGRWSKWRTPSANNNANVRRLGKWSGYKSVVG